MKVYRWDSADEQELSMGWVRIVIAIVFLVVLVTVLVLRIFFLQVVQHEHYTTLSRDNRIRVEPVLPQRGEIYSSDGVLLAGNLPTYNLVLLADSEPLPDARMQELARLLSVAPADMPNRLHTSRTGGRTSVLLEDIGEESLAVFSAQRHRFPGVGITTGFRRYYPLAGASAHMVGRIGGIDDRSLEHIEDPQLYRARDRIGKSGIEHRYEDLLRGRLGYRRVEVNAEGRTVRILETVSPLQGERLVLNINADLQLEAHALLADRTGAVVALEPGSGRVLALVSAPTYDPNLFTVGLDISQYRRISSRPGAPLYDRSTRGQYPPGSVIKPFLAHAALRDGLRETADSLRCGGSYQLQAGGRKFRDWKKQGHGELDLAAALEQSCDVYFYQLAHDMGIGRLAGALRDFGFGRPTGVDLYGEKSGLVPGPEWKRREYDAPWYTGETLNAGIGQGYVLATPLQMAVATAALAGDGRLPVPVLLSARYDPLTDELIEAPRTLHTMVAGEPQHWEWMHAAMRRVVHGARGTARGIALGLSGYEIAGKTGTAQVVVRELSGTTQKFADHSLFIGYAPVSKPRIALAVLVEHSGSGSAYAAPLARRLFDLYLNGGAQMAVGLAP